VLAGAYGKGREWVEVLPSHLTGEELYGDDFTPSQIARWLREESSAYFDLAGGGASYSYGYHALNQLHAYRHLKGRTFERCLAIGCARGDEILPICSTIREIVAIEPAREWWSSNIGGTPARYLAPQTDGKLPLDDETVDVVTCFGVLHHIPNVSAVLAEIQRVSKPGGIILMREPNSSMGDWRKPRRGATKNERGIPERWMKERAGSLGFEILSITRCITPLCAIAARLGIQEPLNRREFVWADYLIASMLAQNVKYWRDRLWKKIAPGSTYYVLMKSERGRAAAS
jgi:SAM-dependent methyltransferase